MTTEIVQAEAPREVTPMEMLSRAMETGANVEQLQKLMDLQERYEASQALRAYNRAFAEFKAEAVTVYKRKQVEAGPLQGKKHLDLADLVESVTPFLSRHGLSISWQLTRDEPAWMEVTCMLRHVGGHVETYPMGGPPDTGPGRNALQARGSTKTYLERYTATGILGIAARDQDNDGRPAAVEVITEAQAADLAALVEEVGADMAQFLRWLRVESLADLPAIQYKKAVTGLEAKRRRA